jgi:hypothetical protein
MSVTIPGNLDGKHGTRSTDDAGIRFDRVVPLWGVVGTILTMAGMAATLWFGQQAQTREMTQWSLRQTEMAADIKAIYAKINESSLSTGELRYTVLGLQDRVRALEEYQRALRK